MKIIFSLTLAALLLLPLFAGCGSDQKPAGSGAATTAAGGEQTSSETTTAETTLHDEVPALDYKGATVNFYIRENLSLPEYYVEDLNGEVVNDALYERNSNVQDRLNVKFAWSGMLGDFSTRKTFAQAVEQSVLAGAKAYDIVSAYSMTAANMAFAKILRNMNDTAYVDLNKPWWPSSLVEETTVNGFLPFVSGDISTQLLYALEVIAFNKSMLADQNIPFPYDLVREGKWTVDKMLDIIKGTYVDLNGDGAKDTGDSYGFVLNHVWSDSFFWACGMRTLEQQKGKIVVSPLFSSEKVPALIEKLAQAFHAENDTYYFPNDDTYLYTFFKEERALFIDTAVNSILNRFRDVEFEYGIVPVPKWDEAQENYITTMSFTYSLYGIPIDVDEDAAVRSSAVLECLASESYFLVTPAVFETAMKTKYASDPDSAEMYDIIRAGTSFDIGRVFNDSLGGKTYSLFRNCVRDNVPDWVSTLATNLPIIEAGLADLNDAYSAK